MVKKVEEVKKIKEVIKAAKVTPKAAGSDVGNLNEDSKGASVIGKAGRISEE